MFNFFKKQKDEEQTAEEDAPAGTSSTESSSFAANQNEQQAGAQALEDKKIAFENDITIHVMPERFRLVHAKASRAKTTGLIIVVGGVLFLIVVAALLYFYLFSGGANNSDLAPASGAPETAAVEKNKTSDKPSAEEEGGALNKEPSGTPETEASSTEDIIAEMSGLESGATSTPEEAEASAGARPSDLIISVDSDQDGLTDKEEELLGSGAASRDSDQDGYDDLSETMNLYNPAGPDKLLVNPNIKSYFNTVYHYSLLYSAIWQQSEISGADSVIFKSSDQQFMQIIVQPNAGKESINDWYNKQFGESEIGSSRIITAGSWQGIKNEDGLTVYLTDYGYKYIFILTYNSGLSKTLDYKNIFEIMVKSFEISR